MRNNILLVAWLSWKTSVGMLFWTGISIPRFQSYIWIWWSMLELVVKGTGACFALEAANIAESTLFPGISTKCKPITTKSRCFKLEDFIAMEIGKLQKDGVIELSMSQVIVVKDETKTHTQKKIMCRLFSNHKYLHRIKCLSINKDLWPGCKSCQV